MPKWLIYDAFTLLINEKDAANYAILQCKTFGLKIWLCKILDKYHVWQWAGVTTANISMTQVSNELHAANSEFSSVEANANASDRVGPLSATVRDNDKDNLKEFDLSLQRWEIMIKIIWKIWTSIGNGKHLGDNDDISPCLVPKGTVLLKINKILLVLYDPEQIFTFGGGTFRPKRGARNASCTISRPTKCTGAKNIVRRSL